MFSVNFRLLGCSGARKLTASTGSGKNPNKTATGGNGVNTEAVLGRVVEEFRRRRDSATRHSEWAWRSERGF